MGLPDIFGFKRRAEERWRREEQENRLRRARLLDAPGSSRSAANYSPMNPASPVFCGADFSPSPSYARSDYSSRETCTGPSSYADSDSSCSGGDGGGGGGGGD
ncbi:hypothetical protein [Methylorubrum thiocyanatum]